MKNCIHRIALIALTLPVAMRAQETAVAEQPKEGIVSQVRSAIGSGASYLKDQAGEQVSASREAAKTIYASPKAFAKALVSRKTFARTWETLTESKAAQAWCVGAAAVALHPHYELVNSGKSFGKTDMNVRAEVRGKAAFVVDSYTRLPNRWYKWAGAALAFLHYVNAAYETAYEAQEEAAQEDANPVKKCPQGCKNSGCKGGGRCGR